VDRGLHPPGDGQIGWRTEPVRDEGRFEGNYGPPGLKRLGDCRFNP
jgi:hypothetical protein